MDKRYQVFVSSTYEDLKVERQKIMQALMALDCLPSSMEIFPASSEDSWTYIARVIDDCDYYVLVIAGRYGSVNEDGISCTEREYEYALETGKKVLCFIHADPTQITAGNVEPTELGRERLEAFKAKAKSKLLTRSWRSAEELALAVTTGISTLIRDHPGVGWVRGDRARSAEDLAKIADLQERLEAAEARLESLSAGPPPGTEGLASGGEVFTIRFDFVTLDPGSTRLSRLAATGALTWDEMFGALGPAMTHEATEDKLEARLSLLATDRVRLSGRGPTGRHVRTDVNHEDFETILIQFVALGLIQQSERKRSVKDVGPHWELTEYGRRNLLRLRAVPQAVPAAS